MTMPREVVSDIAETNDIYLGFTFCWRLPVEFIVNAGLSFAPQPLCIRYMAATIAAVGKRDIGMRFMLDTSTYVRYRC